MLKVVYKAKPKKDKRAAELWEILKKKWEKKKVSS